ncbi:MULTISPECIES: deoxyribose-phosphate aldolase [Treponema]|uniref:Deoxyribose-phosphate aldolase n=1 Tax=Treponema rectale TaxID=744512 RepID=A0A840SCD1_9SPIR|nr:MULTISPECIES: deoxyribose-phosphate aldolase [Treponema]MBB5219437.1 deoxyribose-phosphate aldolase [Treponema rectale]MBE6353998.1 deoxyribose-phosphate aldolase [Treponema sp.]MBO6177299.1 deoxyribose-phosphate aldolase [Treponema sp.]
MTKNEIAGMIDHTQLAPTARKSDIEKLCEEAKKYQFASVCVNPSYVHLASELLEGTSVKVCTVIGFPLGASGYGAKSAESFIALDDGADELDMVINIGEAKDHNFDAVEEDIKSVVMAARQYEQEDEVNKKIIVKVILETCFLTDDEIVECCKRSVKAGADFVKTSTGFANPKDAEGKPLPNGATVHAVELMRKTVGPDFGVKASGGIRSAEDAQAMVNAGASRIGCSAGVKIVENWK